MSLDGTLGSLKSTSSSTDSTGETVAPFLSTQQRIKAQETLLETLPGNESRLLSPQTAVRKAVADSARDIPFHRASLGEQEIAALAEVVRSGWITMGAKTIEFEERFAAYVGARHAIAVSSGTAALHLGLETVGIQPDDEVLIPTNTFTATGEVVKYLGGRPVLVDIDPVTLNVDPVDVARKVTSRTRAIMPVHLAGQPCDMGEIHALARAHNLHVIEDAAHALPSEYRGTRIGALSELTAFSFYATKTLTTGEGGMITTDNDDYAARLRMMRLHGISGDAWKRYGKNGTWYYEVVEAGYKYNLTDLQSALGLVQLTKCDAMNEARGQVAQRYTAAFREIASLEPPTTRDDRKTSSHLYILRLHLDQLTIDRAGFVAELKKFGVATSVHFIPLHLHPFYQRCYGYRPGDMPVAETEFERYFSLPIYPSMTDAEADYVIAAVADVAERFKR
jgi:dTDP-4-amino-4,6-dideoxygalactose transaminase